MMMVLELFSSCCQMTQWIFFFLYKFYFIWPEAAVTRPLCQNSGLDEMNEEAPYFF